jgi:alpha-1,6-mannosyltransferase
MANFVTVSSGGLRTALRCLGEGYRAAGHEPVLIVPGDRFSDEHTGRGRVINPAPARGCRTGAATGCCCANGS